MPTEDTDRFSRRPNDSSRVTNSKLLPQTSSHVNDVPRVLPQHQTVLQMPGVEQEIRLLIKKMVLIVCRLSSSPMIHRDFLKRQPLLSYSPGEKELLNSTPPTSKDGLNIVIRNRLIQFLPLFPSR